MMERIVSIINWLRFQVINMKKPKKVCSKCGSLAPKVIMTKDERYGFISYMCDDLFHDDLVNQLNKLYYDDNSNITNS